MSATPMRPETRYASSPEGYVAYHVFGAGPPDLLFLAHFVGSRIEFADQGHVHR